MNKIYEKIFTFVTYTGYFLYILAIFGISNFAPKYLEYLKSFLKYYIAIILIILFNPYKKIQLYSNFDRKMAFSAGIFLLLSTTLISGLQEYITNKSRMYILNNFY